MPGQPTAGGRPPDPEAQADLLTIAARERTVLASGFLSGLCVFFAPLAVLAVGLLGAYVASVVSDGTLSPGRPLERADFQGVFAPAINEAPLLLTAGLLGAFLGQFRRWLLEREGSVGPLQGRRPFFRELAFVYVVVLALLVAVAALRGGWLQLDRIVDAAPAVVLLMFCAAWLVHAVWSYCFRNLIDLLATGPEREAAAALRGRGRRLKTRGSHI